MLMDSIKQGEREIAPETTARAKTFSHQEDADGTWLQFCPLLYSQLSWLCFSSCSSSGSSRENLSAHGALLLFASFDIRKAPSCSDQRHPRAPGELYNHWNPWHPHPMLRSASHSYFCCSSLFPSKLLRNPPPTNPTFIR